MPPEAQAPRITRNGNKDGASLSVTAHDVQTDHNTFRNRNNEGVCLRITGPASEIATRSWIRHNYFDNRQFTGANGGESIRLGCGHKQSKSANGIVEYNLFEKADGDAEAISIKSPDNLVRGSSGGVVSTHSGSTVKYDGNVIWGGTGGNMPSSGYGSVDPKLVKDANRLFRLSSGSPAIDASVRKLLTKADVGVYAP